MTVTKTNANVHRGRFVIRFYSHKNQCALNPESFQELILAFKLECDPNVKLFATQPEQIEVNIVLKFIMSLRLIKSITRKFIFLMSTPEKKHK